MRKTTAALLMLASGIAAADMLAIEDITVNMTAVDATGATKEIGTVNIHQTRYGIEFAPKLTGLTPGMHGFHMHQNPSCAPGEKDGKMMPALAAGGHYDPGNTGLHEGPWADGHLGDLPALYVDEKGNAANPVLAPRLKLSDLNGHALMLHFGGDNHSDHPNPLGGGGARIACVVIK